MGRHLKKVICGSLQALSLPLKRLSVVHPGHFPKMFSVCFLHMFRAGDPYAGADTCDPAEELRANRHQYGHTEYVVILRDHHDVFSKPVDDHPGQTLITQKSYPGSLISTVNLLPSSYHNYQRGQSKNEPPGTTF